MIKYDFNELTRINKKQARSAYDNGAVIRICMNKVNPTNEFYHLYVDIQKSPDNNKNFNNIINAYEHYNGCYECGYYCNYYLLNK